MRVALIHDWVLGMRGGEKVLDALAHLYPHAELFTLLADPDAMPASLTPLKRHTSWLQQLPGVKRYYRKLLPWMPGAIEQFDLSGFDLVISSSHCVAKGVVVPKGVPHLCYCHTPMRYAWQLQELYLERVPRMLRSWARSQLMKLRQWDKDSAQRVTQFIANGKTVQQRISDCYGRDSRIIYPPIDTTLFVPDASVKRDDFYLAVSALAPNKRIDLAVGACNQMGRKLIVIGSGEERARLQRLAGPETTFLGWCDNATIRTHLQSCRALLFPGEEDFGMVPLEAQACGTPVIAYGVGGATETVLPLGSVDPTGILFQEATISSLMEAMRRYESERHTIRLETCRQNAEQYGIERFNNSIQQTVQEIISANIGKGHNFHV